MFEVTKDAVQVWLDDVEVFKVGVEQVSSWVDSARVDRFYPRYAGKYVVAMCGARFDRDYWASLSGMRAGRVMLSRAFDSLAEAMAEIRFHVECDLLACQLGPCCVYDYEIWHLCDDSMLYVETLLDGRPRFSDMAAVVEYVETSLGDLAPEFDCWAIAQDVTLYVNGFYYDVKDHEDYWRCVASHVL